MSDLIEKHFRFFALCILILAAFNLFFQLGKTRIEDWDEARHGISAFEMIQHRDYVLTTYMDQPDYWNLKPPLGVWLIAASYKVFGYNAFALRFPSALSAFLCIILVVVFTKKHYGSKAAILSGLILVTTFDFIIRHSGRTGDFDAQMAFLVLSVILLLSEIEKRHYYFYLSGFIIGLSFLLKSFAFIQILAVTSLFLIISKKYRQINFTKLILFIGALVLPVLTWGLFRYHQDGMVFFHHMISYDLLARSSKPLEGHNGSILYYFEILYKNYYWLLVIFFIPLLKKRDRYKLFQDNNFRLILLSIIVPFILFSLAQTKLNWYINTIYAPLAMFIGIWLSRIFKILPSRRIINLIIVFIVLISLGTQLKIIKRIQRTLIVKHEQQSLILNLSPHRTLYKINEWSQAENFLLKVVKDITPSTVSSVEEFMGTAKPDKLLFINSAQMPQGILEKLNIIEKKQEWLVVSVKS